LPQQFTEINITRSSRLPKSKRSAPKSKWMFVADIGWHLGHNPPWLLSLSLLLELLAVFIFVRCCWNLSSKMDMMRCYNVCICFGNGCLHTLLDVWKCVYLVIEINSQCYLFLFWNASINGLNFEDGLNFKNGLNSKNGPNLKNGLHFENGMNFKNGPNKKLIKILFMVYSLQRILVLPYLHSKCCNKLYMLIVNVHHKHM
jgi:hypothetical protein